MRAALVEAVQVELGAREIAQAVERRAISTSVMASMTDAASRVRRLSLRRGAVHRQRARPDAERGGPQRRIVDLRGGGHGAVRQPRISP